jgi:cell division protein FtsL
LLELQLTPLDLEIVAASVQCLEQSAWSTHAFVERVASTKLHMAMPPPKEIEIIAP